MCIFDDETCLSSAQETAGSGLNRLYKHRLFNVLCWLGNIYEGAELLSQHKTLCNVFSTDLAFRVLLVAVSCVAYKHVSHRKYTHYVALCCIN